MQIKIGFKKLHKDATIPKFAKKGDAGMDLTSAMEMFTLRPLERKLVKTGLAIELPSQTEAQVRPRSGLALNNGVTVLNTPGTIDQGFKGEISIILINLSNEDFVVKKGMRIAQLVIKPIYDVQVAEIEELTESSRGEGGFGSSGLT